MKIQNIGGSYVTLTCSGFFLSILARGMSQIWLKVNQQIRNFIKKGSIFVLAAFSSRNSLSKYGDF
jgi:hypothetical protein